MITNSADTDELVDRAAGGDAKALGDLFARHRDRLRRMIALRIDRRLVRRLDPSDIVQEALAEAAREFPAYAASRPLPFLAWLRQIGWNRLVKAHRRHITAQRRSLNREEHAVPGLSERALADLSDCFCPEAKNSAASPLRKMVRDEMRERVAAALEELAAYDREVLVLRYLEQLSMREIAQVLSINEAAARQRHARALKRLQTILAADGQDKSEEQT
jgi:RNA polymerase sigma-70 factor (ECF subfamily)